MGCFNLKTVEMPEKLEIIDRYAFCGTGIESIEIPDSVKSIGYDAFDGCNNLCNVKLSKSIEKIENSVFSSCKVLESIEIPEGVKSIGYSAFKDCLSLKRVDIPDSVEEIGVDVFKGCTLLDRVKIPSGMTSINSATFSNCAKLSAIYIPKTVEAISDDAFENCYFLKISSPKGSPAIEYAKAKGIKYIEIFESEETGEFNAEISSDVIANIGEGEELPIVSNKSSAIFDSNSVIQIQHKHGNKDIIFNYNIVDKNDADDSMQEALSDFDVLMNFDLIDSDGEKVIFSSEDNGGTVTITVPYKAPVKAKKVTVYYIDAEGNKHDMGGVYDPANKTISFTTTHFSYYGIEVLDENEQIIKNDVDAIVHIHVLTTVQEASESSCIEAGSNEIKKCGLCKKYFDDDVKYDTEAEAKVAAAKETIDHKCITVQQASESGCTEAGSLEIKMCDNCETYFVGDKEYATEAEAKAAAKKDATGHTYTTVQEASESGCTEEGSLEIKKCESCETYFVGDKEYATEAEAKAAAKKNATGHTYTTVQEASESGCTEVGSLEIKKCENCETYFVGDKEYATETEAKAAAKKTAKGHNYTTIQKASEPSCTEAGNFEIKKCGSCGKYLVGETEYATETEAKAAASIKAKGHSYVETATKATTNANGSIVKKCTICGNIESTTVIYYPKDITLSDEKYVYDGKSKTPTVAVKASNGEKLVKDKDHTVFYANVRKNVGKYAVTITFKGNYEGSVTKYFEIAPKGTKIKKLTPAAKAFKVKWAKNKAETTGYQIRYSLKKNMSGAKTVTVKNNKTTSKTIKKLKSKKKYYVQIRTYKTLSDGKKYSDWSKVKTIKTK